MGIAIYTQNWRDYWSIPTDALGQALGPNLLREIVWQLTSVE